ncbi:MAG: hypothetical protein AAFR65_08150 [Pseudomonadota bacterium]
MTLKGRHILLVEDDPLVSAHLQAVLGGAGAQVTALATARELDAFNPAATDLAVLDISLSDGHIGDHLAPLSAAGVSLLFHTGADDTAELTHAHPAARVLAKPSREAELLAICAEMIDARG